jgi:biotin carboxyl carrier protein
MKLVAEIAGVKHELTIKRDESRVVAEIDGRAYELEAHAPRAGVYLLLRAGRVFHCRVDGAGAAAAAREHVEVTIGNSSYTIRLLDPRRLASTEQAGAHADGTAQIVAPMPGKVVRVLVEEGAEVEAGDGIVIVEAMKMQNELKAPKAGKVSSIRTSSGATVNAGDVLAVVE